MAIDIIPKSLYPLVPQALGVPPLLRNAARIIDTVTLGYLGVSDALNSIIGAPVVKWAVFDDSGAPIADYDSVLAFGYQNELRISDYPVEQGQFASYNKTDNPFDVVVTFTCGGSDERRTAFLSALENAKESLQTYTVTTPDYSYRNVNFVGIRTQRSSREGATLLTVEMAGREIRNTGSSTFPAPKSDAGFPTVEQGMIQTVDDPNFDASGVV
jgi:hypothetical protein